MFVPELFVIEFANGVQVVARVACFLNPLEITVTRGSLKNMSHVDQAAYQRWANGVAEYLCEKWGIDRHMLHVCYRQTTNKP
jgi:hypothetical protein